MMLPGCTERSSSPTRTMAAADDVVDLLLLVRLLRIDATSREDVQAEAERWHAEEFEIELAGFHALPVEVGEFEGVHRVATLTDRASWSQGSPFVGSASRSISPRRSGMRSRSISARDRRAGVHPRALGPPRGYG